MPILQINQDWTGYVINHLRKLEDPHYRDPEYYPETDDWRKITRNITLEEIPVFANFLLVAKIGVLVADPDSLERYPKDQEIPIYEILYDYGTWQQGLPERQDKVARLFIGDLDEETGFTRLSLDIKSRLIPRYKPIEDLESIVVQWRKKASLYLKARAKQLGLGQQVIDFFSDAAFTTAELQFIESGSTAIIDLLNKSTARWLDIPVPDDPEDRNIRQQIIFQFQLTQTVPTSDTIENAISAVYTPSSFNP